MIKYIESNVFNSNADAIVNTINCVGFMGKGIALEFSLRYPSLLLDYKEKCQKKKIKVGEIYYYQSSDKLIVNFPTKDDYKFPSKLEWIENDLINFRSTYKEYNIKTIAFPLLGCCNGGLNPNVVIKLMQKYLSNLDIDVLICLDKTNPEGKEKEMIGKFNNLSIDDLEKIIRLTSAQKKALKIKQGNIKRFFELSKTPSIGFTTYKKIFDLLYNDYSFKSCIYEQKSLF